MIKRTICKLIGVRGATHPVILRSKDCSYFTRLAILDAYEATMHHGIETTLARIRENYWIVKGRKSVKEVIRKCVMCTRYQGQPVRAPSSPDLLEYRVDHMAYAFQFTGLGFAGPLFVKDGLKSSKCYILLLTCASVAMNNRPLAYLSEDDLDEALTPFHLMYGRSTSTGKQFNSVDCVSISSLESCKQRLFHLRKVLKDFWKRFRASYLNELRQMNLYRKVKGNDTNSITIDDVVLMKDDEPAPRTQWRIGRVLQLVKGRDGQVRGARLKVLSKAGKQSSVHRPVQRLIPFEIQENSVVNYQEIQPEIEGPGTVSSAQPRRKAAVEGQAMHRVCKQYT